jgi:hypothetical protein
MLINEPLKEIRPADLDQALMDDTKYPALPGSNAIRPGQMIGRSGPDVIIDMLPKTKNMNAFRLNTF